MKILAIFIMACIFFSLLTSMLTNITQILISLERSCFQITVLPNMKFIPFQPRQRLPEVPASADVSLVSLKRGIGKESLPSKTYSILASGRPAVVSVDEESGTRKLVMRADVGLCVHPENASELVEAILVLKKDDELRERMGRNGRNWAEIHHSPQAGAKQIEKIMLEITASKNQSRI